MNVHRRPAPGVAALAALCSLLTLSCGGHPQPSPQPAAGAVPAPLAQAPEGTPAGLALRVSAGQRGPEAPDRASQPPATRLAPADAEALLARVAPLKAAPDDARDFALRSSSTPPPRAGKTLAGTFPPPPDAGARLAPPAASAAPLKVLRYMPEGKVPLAPELSVTFSEPMVAVTSQDDAAKEVPVRLTPQPKGRWRWIGTRTILFDPEVRFPQATTYQVEIPAGTRSATGASLAQAVRFTFETPAPSLVSYALHDGDVQRTDAPMFALFDQKIAPAAMLAAIKVSAGGPPVAVRLLDAAEIAKDADLKARVDAAEKGGQAGRYVVFRAVAPLPLDAAVHVEIGAGAPSAEGPNRTMAAQGFAFHTYAPLRIVEARCGWGDACRPGMPLRLELNNPLDEARFDDAQLTITPPLPGAKVVAQGQGLELVGLTSARTRYTVRVAGALRDAFGQTLGRDETRTFDVGDASPTFFGPSGMVVLDPAAKRPTLDFFSVNYAALQVRLYKVGPADLGAYRRYVDEQWNHDRPPPPPGAKVFDGLVPTSGGANALAETHVDLAPALGKAGLGHVVAVVEPSPWKEPYPPPRLIAWVQSTRLAVDAHVDADALVAFATDLATGAPAAGVGLELVPHGLRAATDATGLARLDLPETVSAPQALVARRGDDLALLVATQEGWGGFGDWFKQGRAAQVAWYVADDRKLYRPGEEVHLKGWLRSVEAGQRGDVAAADGVTAVTYELTDAEGATLLSGRAPVGGLGGFDAAFTLPKTPNLGYASVRFQTVGKVSATYDHGLRIEEFRRPEFEVSARASGAPYLVGGAGDVTVTGAYLAGGPLPGAPVRWTVTASATTFTPPGRDAYVFGAWSPWWGFGSFEADEGAPSGRRAETSSWSLDGKTDATGAHTLHLDFLSSDPAVPRSVVATASVTDVNRQQWSASQTLLVHPSTAYVGLKLERGFVEKGTPMPVEVIGVDLDGKALVGATIDVRAVRLDWAYQRGRYVTREVEPQACKVVAAEQPGRCELATPKGGEYKLYATIVDAKGRPSRTTMTYFVSGGDQPPAREVAQEQVRLVPDRKEYREGETARILVQAPFYPAEGVVTWRREGIVKVERLTMAGPTTTIQVPIGEHVVPGLYVQVDLVGAAGRTDDHGKVDPALPKRPAYAVGMVTLAVPPRARTLAVTATPATAKVAPGEETSVAVEVKDAAGRPVAGAEAAVIVVDEAILTLAAYEFPDPVSTFYGMREPGVLDRYLRAAVKLARPDPSMLGQGGGGAGGGGLAGRASAMALPAPAAAAPGGAAMEDKAAGLMMKEEAEVRSAPRGGGAAGPAIALRSNFNPLAAFAPVVATDAAGRATVKVKVPDNLTRYRIVALVAAGAQQFGKGEATLTARLPLMVRPSPPRFLNFGDAFRLPVVVQNQTDAPMTVRLAVRATNAALTDGAGREVAVPANDRVEVQFPAAAERAGTARFQVVGTVVGDAARSDAAELALPVWTPATTEAFAAYGTIDAGAVRQPVALPEKVVTSYGGLEVTTSSTNLQALTDALIYLVAYPFECAEQRASRILAIAALRDVLTAFHAADLPTPEAMAARVAADLERLANMQNDDGGFGFWDRGEPSWPFLSVHVTSALARAKAKGYPVPASMLERAQAHLRAIEDTYPAYYPQDVRWSISAYALEVRARLGDVDLAKAKRLVAEAGVAKLPMEALGWLLQTMARAPAAQAERQAILRRVMNGVSETAGAASFTTGYGDGAYLLLSSDRRVDGVLLEALIAEQPDLDLIPKLVTGLLGHRKAGHWLNTQDNAFVLAALDRYFETYEKTTPNFVARVWLGAGYAGDHPFVGRSTDSYRLDLPMGFVASHDRQDLTIQKDGAGRLYYRVGMTYAPASLTLAPADHGFVVERRYEAVDDPKDVTRAADGAWHVKAGARVRVAVTMVNESRRYHVALVDPLPAGLEIVNPALATTGPVPLDPGEQASRGAYWWWYGPWYEHQNLRDERAEAFASMLWEGVHRYAYVARATTPGTFVVPPPKAEEMYMPETFGRGGTDRVVVE